MRLNRTATAFLALPMALGMARVAAAQNLTLDDFSSGPYKKRLAGGQDVATQAGTMIGGDRLTVFSVCQAKPCGLQNPFGQAGAFQIRAKTKFAPPALIYSAGYKVFPRLDVEYGANTPLQLDLSRYDRLRITFDGSDLVVNFNIVVFTPSGYRQTGCNLDPSLVPVSIDFPLADFQGKADFSNVSAIDVIFQSGSAVGANDWAVTSFEAIAIGEPSAGRVCHGLGT